MTPGNRQPFAGFTPKRILLLGTLFAVGLLLLNGFIRWYRTYFPCDCHAYWPVQVHRLLFPGWYQFLLGGVCLLVFGGGLYALERCNYNFTVILGVVLVLLLGTNLLPGYSYGYRLPTAYFETKGDQYYHDAVRVESVSAFLGDYVRRQQTRDFQSQHSVTHPAGAVLTYFFLAYLLEAPGLISLTIGLISTTGTLLFLQALFRRYLDNPERGYLLFLYGLLPAVQIYYLSSLDALVATLGAGFLFFWTHPRSRVRMIGTTGCLLLLSGLTFGALFFLPVVLGSELLEDGSLKQSLGILLVLALAWYGIEEVFGYSYVQSFRAASVAENPRGFRLLASPFNYLITRLECVLEILVFLGPFLLWSGYRSLGTSPETPPVLDGLFSLGIGTLLLMFLVGAFRTGETARTTLFVLPFLLLLFLGPLRSFGSNPSGRISLAALVFLQTLLMQGTGIYFW